MDTFKKNILVIIAIMLFSFSYSQQCDNFKKHKAKMEAEKIAFITEKLNLSVKEAQQFWPIYNELQNKKDVLRKKKRNLMKIYRAKSKTMTNAEIEKSIDEIISIDLKIEELKIDYHKKYKKIIGVRKVAILYDSDREFRRELLRKLKQSNKCR